MLISGELNIVFHDTISGLNFVKMLNIDELYILYWLLILISYIYCILDLNIDEIYVYD